MYSSWNGLAVLDPKPFLPPNNVRFRRGDVESGECSASECGLVATDFWRAGFGRVQVVPSIQVRCCVRWFFALNHLLPSRQGPSLLPLLSAAVPASNNSWRTPTTLPGRHGTNSSSSKNVSAGPTACPRPQTTRWCSISLSESSRSWLRKYCEDAANASAPDKVRCHPWPEANGLSHNVWEKTLWVDPLTGVEA